MIGRIRFPRSHRTRRLDDPARRPRTALARCATLALAALLLGPSAGAEDRLRDPVGAHEDVSQMLERVDWSAARVVEIEMDEHRFTPSQIELEQGRPHLLRLANRGQQAHDMAGGSLFSAIAVKTVNTDGGRLVTPVMRSLHLERGQTMEILMVPLRAGTHSFFCNLGDHRQRGMEGSATIR